jgi:hypothetical protein
MKSLAPLILIALVFSNQTWGKCLTVKESDVSIRWTAFKTPSKVGVGGTLPKLKFNSKVKGTSVKDALYGQEISIDTSTVNTGNKARDAKISKFFFANMTGKYKIGAAIKKIEDKIITISVAMNGKTLDVPMAYTILGNELKAKGVIDILDFGMSKGLKTINKACKALHQGKTWNDVNLELTAQFSSCKK